MKTWPVVIACAVLVAAARAQDGQPDWAFPFSVGGFISSSPAVSPDGSIVYVGVETTGNHGRIFAIRRDESLKWVTTPDLPRPINSSPALAGDTLYVGGDDGRFYALNIETGAIRWQKQFLGFITSSPAIGSDGTIYFGAQDGKLHALAPNGDERWTFSTPDTTFIIASSPAIAADGTIYIGSYDRNLYAVRPDGTERWRFATGGRIYSSPAIGADGTIYVGSGDQRLYAISPDGQRKWDYLTNGDIQSSPALGPDGTIYFGADVTFYALRPDGTEQWKVGYGSTTQSTAAVRADGTIIFGADDGKLRALNPDGKSFKWVYDTKTGVDNLIESSPVIASDGAIYFGSLDGNLYKIRGNNSPLSTFSSWPAFRRDAQHNARVPAANPGQLFNLSTRAFVPAGGTVIVGFFVQGVSQKAYLIRGIGPALGQFGISGFMTDPRLDLYAGSQLLNSNDNWSDAPGSGIVDTTDSVGAFRLPSGSKDAVILAALGPGGYTAQIRNQDNVAGVALVEAYDAIGGDATARLVNVSTLGPVGSGRENYLVAGVVVGGSGPTRLLIRAVGPSLAPLGVSGALARPLMSLYTTGATPRLLRTNSGWTSEGLKADIAGAANTVAAFALAENSADAAMIVTVDPGNYTVEISGVNDTTGQALVELYVLP